MALLNRLLKLHSKGNRPLEDFFTEIVAYLLEINESLLYSWLRYAHILEETDYVEASVSTQETFKNQYKGNERRIDFVIRLKGNKDDDIIFIESKVASKEGFGNTLEINGDEAAIQSQTDKDSLKNKQNNQLSAYAEILDSLPGYRNRFLVYITRDFDPKEESKIFQGTPEAKVKFKQLRWHHFYQFLLSVQDESELVRETIIFMQENRMAHNNQFSAVDILTLANLSTFLELMEAVMWEEVVKSFAGLVAENKDHDKKAIETLQRDNWYRMERWVPKQQWACYLGFRVQREDLYGYPAVALQVGVGKGAPRREELIRDMREICGKFPNWRANNLDAPDAWSTISLEKNMRDFLSKEDHVFEIKKFFLDSLKELSQIKQQYPNWPWGL
jgi:hypothetical protein